MRDLQRSIAVCAAILALTAVTTVQPALSLDPDFAAIEAQENAANSKPGPRVVPGRPAR
jgi:hypothetical protein